MKRPDETSRLDFSESRLLTWTPCIVALLICGVGFSLYKRWPAALFCLVTAAVGASARIWAARALDRVTASLTADRSGLLPGDVCRVEFTVDNPKWLPLVWLTLRFPLEREGALLPEQPWEMVELANDGETSRLAFEKNVSFLMWHQRIAFSCGFRAQHRGLLRLDRVSLLSGDGLCLCGREAEFPLPRPLELVVYPRLVPVSTAWFRKISWELETGARGINDDPTVIRNVRAYQPGDNARALNYRLMARGQGAMVNIYEKISPRRATFLLDGASFRTLPPEAFEEALEITASLLTALAEEQVALTVLTSRSASGLPAFSRCRDRKQLPQALMLLAAADTTADLESDTLMSRLTSFSNTVCVCGDCRELDGDVCALLARHHVPLLTWGEQTHPLLRTVDLRSFRTGGAA